MVPEFVALAAAVVVVALAVAVVAFVVVVALAVHHLEVVGSVMFAHRVRKYRKR